VFGADFFRRMRKGSRFAFAIERVFEEGQFECVLLYIALLLIKDVSAGPDSLCH
jgi:hypothetical protein